MKTSYGPDEPLAHPLDAMGRPKIHGSLPRESVPMRYRVGIVLATVGMLFLPALYIFFVVGVFLATAWHLWEHIHWLVGHQARWWGALAYVCIGGVGIVQGLFLFKPLWAVTRPDPRDRRVSPEEESHLFDFVRDLCRITDAPVPLRIYLNSEVNAFARYAPGVINLLRGRVELVFGLSLVDGLTVQQFAAMVTHELAHFGQGMAIRLIYIVRGVERWFEQAVHGRDAWDEWLERGSRRLDLGVGFFCHIARGYLWLTRQALKPFMAIGRLLSCYLLRQMELDADRYAVRLAGVEAFESLLVQTRILEAARGLARKTLSLSWREGRLGDDFPALVKAHTRIFIAEVRDKIHKEMWAERSGPLHTHPSFGERVAAARKLEAPGLCRLPAEAPSLFCDFPARCREVTLRLYASDLQEEFYADRLVSTSDIMQGQSQMQAGEAALESYFFSLLSSRRPLRLAASGTPALPAYEIADLPEARRALHEARARIAAALPEGTRNYHQLLRCEQRLLQALQAGALLSARFHIEPEDFHLETATVSASVAAVALCLREQNDLADRLEPLEAAFSDRLVTALAALPALVASQGLRDGPEFLDEANGLLPTLAGLLPALTEASALRKDFSEMVILVENLDGNEKGHELGREIAEKSVLLRASLLRLRRQLGATAHPFPKAAKPGATLADYVLDALPEADDYERVFDAADKALARLEALYLRIMGQLALIAGSVEGALGLGPLHLPVFSDSPSEISEKSRSSAYG